MDVFRGHPYGFDPTYGYGPAELGRVGPPPGEPEDFAAFWSELYARARAVPVTAVRSRLPRRSRRHAVHTYTVKYTSTDGVRIGGWLTLPADGRVERGIVLSHGYGGRSGPEVEPLVPRAAVIQPVARGLGSRSLLPGVPADPQGHVLYGIASRETYIHGGCAADVWCAATALTALVPDAAARIDYVGSSFGGGIGALALPWDERFTSAHLDVPSFGHHPLRVGLECVGSGAAVRERYLRHPEVLDVLAYFDAATAATHLRIPVQVAAALFDPAVPPPGQFSVHNSLAGPRRLHVMASGHFDHPGAPALAAAERAACAAFLTA